MNRLIILVRRCAAISLAAVLSAETLFAGWFIDPDFQPLVGYGFSLEDVQAVQPDGRVVYRRGLSRLAPDGSVDPGYGPPDDGRTNVWASSTGDLVAGFVNNNMGTTTISRLSNNGSTTGSSAVVETGIISGTGFQTDGKFLVSGDFHTVNGMPRHTVARFNTNGTLDETFDVGSGPNNGGSVKVAAQPDGKVLVGGYFDSFSGFPYSGLIRLNNDGTVDTAFNPAALNPGVFSDVDVTIIAADSSNRALVFVDDTLWRFSADGSSVSALTQFDGYVERIVPLNTGKILVSGRFSAVGGEARSDFARINDDGTLDSTFHAAATPSYPTWESQFFVQSDGRILVLSHGVKTGVSTIRLLPDGEVDPGFQPSIPGLASISAVGPTTDGKLYVSGVFTSIDQLPYPSLARLNPDGTPDPSFNPATGISVGHANLPDDDVNYPIESLAVQQDGKLLVAGRFAVAQGLPRTSLARFNSDGSIDPTLNVQLNDEAEIVSVAVQSDGKIMIGGNFTSVGGNPVSHVARLLPDGTLDGSFPVTTGITGLEARVTFVAVLPDDKIMIGGKFDAWNGARRWNILRLNSDGTLDTTYDPGNATTNLEIATAELGSNGVVAAGGPGRAVLIDENATVVLEPDFGGQTADISGNTNIEAIITSPGGGLVIGSSGSNRDLIERFSASGTLDRSLVPELPEMELIEGLARTPIGGIIAAGAFTGMDGLAFTSIVRFFEDESAPSLGSLSTRGYVGEGEEIMIAGLVIKGTERQRVMLRGIGWNLEEFGITDRCEYPQLAVYRAGETTPFAGNYAWFNRLTPTVNMRLMQYFDRFQAFPLKYNNDLGLSGSGHNEDSAILLDLEPGAYTVHVPVNVSGVGLVEVYDVNGIGADRGLISLSTRGLVQTDERALIGGLNIIGGTKRMLIRAVGPGLEQFGVGNILVDPKLDLVRQSDGATIASNDQWESDGNGAEIAEAEVITGAFPLDPGSLDSALLIDLPPGAYTAIVSGVEGTEGVALVEFYEVPSL